MKYLAIMRHAEAKSIHHFSSDRERCLSKKGIEDLEEIQNTLKNIFKDVSLVLCSPSIRTRETYLKIMPILPAVDKILYLEPLYNASCHTLLEEFGVYSQNYESILMVGHNPGVTDFFHEVLSHNPLKNSIFAPSSLPTSGVVTYTQNSTQDMPLKFKDLQVNNFYYPSPN